MKKRFLEAKSDSKKPTVFFRAPVNWLNDLTGLLFNKATSSWHLFYQLNPYGATWGNIVWGHATSSDLVRWRHQPPVLLPDFGADGSFYIQAPQSSFSGGVYINPDNEIVALFTEIGRGQSFRTAPVQRIAKAVDTSLNRFEINDLNLLEHADLSKPFILDQGSRPITKIYDERDPCIFEADGQTFMVLGGTLDKHREEKGVVALYRATDTTWEHWEYMGILYESEEHGLIECPKFFRIGDRWILIISPQSQAMYIAGKFDAASGRFTPNNNERGLVDQMPSDHAQNFYAPYVEKTATGRVLLAGWLTQGPTNESWNGAIVLREVSWKDGRLYHAPLKELERAQINTL